MKIKDYIIKEILQYPTLYKAKNYEESRLQVLNQIFFTLGNGLDFAETEDVAKGGYLVEPKNVELDGDWIRIKDEPYGKETIAPLPKNFFNSAPEVDYPYYPYPFSDYCGIFSEIIKGKQFLQDDWMEELIYLCKRTLEFFADPEQYKHDCYYPKANNKDLKKEFSRFDKYKKGQVKILEDFISKFDKVKK